MSTLLKLLLSPLTLIAALGLIVYLFIKNKSQKDEIEKLKEENKKLYEEKSILDGEAEKFHNKYRKLKKVFELEQSIPEQRLLHTVSNNQTHIQKVKNNKSAFLD